ncbi:MAG: UMP kinase [Verrucomicrobiota bacterium]|jgi:uridylate kinase|nr:UMP kinase [Verrucomicrobiota bacterium]
MKKAAPKLTYRRILLKLSGEVLRDSTGGECLSNAILADMAAQIKAVRKLGVQVGVVIGGGNIFRGLKGQDRGFGRADGDTMGMLATMINSLALQSVLEATGVPAKTLAARFMPTTAELFTHRRAIELLEEGVVVIIGGGTGAPFFTTDSAAALRAAEIHADVLLKATKVDGIYTADPMKDPTATKFDRLTYSDALARRLKVMDSTAFSLCMDNQIPILVFDFFKRGELLRVVQGRKVGTLVSF